MADSNVSAVQYLIINRAEVASEGCNACGEGLVSNPAGERALSVTVGPGDGTYMFCGACGDSIMGHLQADGVRQRYAWDWTVRLRGKPLKSYSH
jgi:hypothetical protein